MSKQKTIASFFKPVTAVKRLSDECIQNDAKKFRHDDSKENTCARKDREHLLKLNKELPSIDPNMGISWYNALAAEFSKPYYQSLDKFLTEERKNFTVYPPIKDVWTWSRLTPLPKVKVVILGQDPYHNPGQAHGLAFSVPRGVPSPPSLLNMYKELTSDIPGFKTPSHGDLTGWAQQGVLLLNASLTVRKNTPNSHAEQGWASLTDAVIKTVSERNRNVVFLLWGAFAQKKASCVDQKKHHLLKAPHPSPFSANRGFLGCKHFSKCNELLKNAGLDPIDWQL